MGRRIWLYDTTLRDGAQGLGVSFTLEGKRQISHLLDAFGVDFIEGGWPGSNPRDEAYFATMARQPLRRAALVAFGSTRRSSLPADRDPNLRALARSGAPVVALFGKCWLRHVHRALRVEPRENLDLIASSVHWLRQRVDRVFFDAEHFFDGFCEHPRYALACLEAAREGGADRLVLCDTNGGMTPERVGLILDAVRLEQSLPLGVHLHNDGDMAVAASLTAIRKGADMVQGTFNGIGERCGNANLCSLIPALKLKMPEYRLADHLDLGRLTAVAREVATWGQFALSPGQPYVGVGAFAHKGGVHVSAVLRDPGTYEHVAPEEVGNTRLLPFSDLAGRSTLLGRARSLGWAPEELAPHAEDLLALVKDREAQGYRYEDANGSLALLVQGLLGPSGKLPALDHYRVGVHRTGQGTLQTEAEIALDGTPLGQGLLHARARGKGPVEALDACLRELWERFFPRMKPYRLVDYRVGILDGNRGTAAHTRVEIRFEGEAGTWGTVGVSENVLEASWQALWDGACCGITWRRNTEKEGEEDEQMQSVELV